ncbi:MAG: exosortase/archaeosortase family protein [Phycisphaerales bacterium]
MNQRRTWRFSDGVLWAGLTALAVFAAWPIVADIARIAVEDPESSQILLAPIVAVWLAWVRRGRVRFVRPEWNMYGPLVILFGWGLAVFGFQNSHQLFEHAGALLMAFGAGLSVIGWRTVWKFAPAFGALIFLLPVPGRVRLRIAGPLQDASAWISEQTLLIFGVGVERLGNILRINGQDVAVAEACNGMRMVAALALISYAFVFSTPMRTWARVLILAISPIVALIVNVLRLTPTALLYGYSTTEVADTFHDLSGWAMLLVALGILWLVLATLRWLEAPVEPYATTKGVAA